MSPKSVHCLSLKDLFGLNAQEIFRSIASSGLFLFWTLVFLCCCLFDCWLLELGFDGVVAEVYDCAYVEQCEYDGWNC